jgi:hypothetical protein
VYHAWERKEMHTTFWSENLKGRPSVDGSIIFSTDSRKIIWEDGDWMHLAPERACSHLKKKFDLQ